VNAQNKRLQGLPGPLSWREEEVDENHIRPGASAQVRAHRDHRQPKTDVVIFGTKRQHGNKISGWGHDGSKEGKKFLLDQLAALLTDPRENVYIEVAGAPAQILTSDRYDVPRVPKENVEAIYHDCDIEWMTDGYYIRTLDTGEQTDIEILLGNPTL